MPPPIVKVIDQDLHHGVLGPSLFVIALKYERGRANGKYCYVTQKNFFKAQRLIKRAAMRKIFSRQKRAADFVSRWRGHAVFSFEVGNSLALKCKTSLRSALCGASMSALGQKRTFDLVRQKAQRVFARYRRRISICIGDMPLSIGPGHSYRLRWQLKHRCLLTLT